MREAGGDAAKSVSDLCLPVLRVIEMRESLLTICAAGAFLGLAGQAMAQGAAPPAATPKPEMGQSCPGLVANRAPFGAPAKLELAALNSDQVRITFVGHATFLIESPKLVRIATDYNDYVAPPLVPDIVTMNHAHTTHFSMHPDPGIKYVLRGWAEDQKPARIDMSLQGRARPQRADQYPHFRRRHRDSTAIPFSFSRSPICASCTSGICTTR